MHGITNRGGTARALCATLSLLAAGASAGCGGTPEPVKLPPPKVTVAHPESWQLTDYDVYNGRTEASEVVEVRARVRGHIVKVDFVDGKTVAKDKVLFELDPLPFDAEIGRAKGQVDIALANQDKSAKEEARQKMLFDKGATTPQQYEQAVAERKSWDAQVAVAREEVHRREIDKQYATIAAPIAGKVGRAMLTEGNLVNAGGSDPLLTTIVKTDPIHVFFHVDERALLNYRERRAKERAAAGKTPAPVEDEPIPFEFGLETDDGFPRKGLIDFADNRIDPATGTIEVRGRAANPDGEFVPGSRVRVRVAAGDPYPALLVPDIAVLTDQDQKYLLVLNAENVVVRRNVRLGRLEPDGMRSILPGGGKTEPLKKDEWVIVDGLQRARINYAVDPRDTSGEAVASTK